MTTLSVRPPQTLGIVGLLLGGLAVACASDMTDVPPGLPPGPPPAAVGWTVLPASPQAASRIEDAAFVSRDTGWVIEIADAESRLYATTDGGSSWSLLYHQALSSATNLFFRSVAFADDTLGWIGNLNGFNSPSPSNALFETTDGGRTLSNITSRVTGPEPVGICGMWVADDSTVYGVGRWSGPAVFLRSFNAGRTWESFDMSPTVTGLVDVYFFDPMHGIIVGGRGVGNSLQAQDTSRTVILATDDGGTTWSERYVSATPGTWAWKISFPTPDTGYVAVQGPALAGTVLKTVDGGQTWTPLRVTDSGGFSGIGFATARMGWVGGGKSTYETTDGGVSWHEVELGRFLNRFRMLGSTLGYVVGDRVYRYQGGP